MNIKKTFFVLLLLGLVQNLCAQKVRDIVRLFHRSEAISWAVPLPGNPLTIQWQERETAFSREGIRTFVGYSNGNLIGTLSIRPNAVSGNLSYNGKEYFINTDNGELHYTEENHSEEGQCGTDELIHQSESAKRYLDTVSEGSEAPQIKNTEILRVYRLAIAVAYNRYSDYYFNSDVQKVKDFWAQTEAFLNEVYMRDLGIRFELINDEKLIIKDAANEMVYDYHTPEYIISYATRNIGALIGDKNFDSGLWLSGFSRTGIVGLAYIFGAYDSGKAAAVVSNYSKETIAHEIGHLFGGRHTFSTQVVQSDSEKTEPGRGQSVMSYGAPRNFFSLSSIQRMRERITTLPYYIDKKRTQVRGDANFPNIPYGEQLTNTPPVIDKSKLKTEYIIPKNTFFQFYIPATDADGDALSYSAQQRDVRLLNSPSISIYKAYKPTQTNPVSFQREYNTNLRGGAIYDSQPPQDTTGEFSFWLAASDPKMSTQNHFITNFDLAQTTVKVIEGKPFKITTAIKKKYKGGEKINLNWEVDEAIFDTDSKVRILLSDDWGQTFKYTLAEEVENNGNCEVTLPNINIGEIEVGSAKLKVNAGIIKVEVIDRLAFDITEKAPSARGGFIVEEDPSLAAEITDLKSSDILIYPNPVKSSFSLKGLPQSSKIKVFDINARLLKSFAPQQNYDVSELSNGNYILSIETPKGALHLKFIKQ